MEELYTSSWDGLTKHKVSAPLQSGGWVRLFGWSPTGDTIAYQAYPVWPGDAYLYTSASVGSENYLIEAGVVGGTDDWGWSPDGTRLGYLAPTGTGPDGLFTNNPTGTDRIRVSPAGGDVWELAWSPDGTRIAYTADQDTDGMDELYTSAWDGTGNYQISVPLDPDGRGVTGFAWSPDGSRVAYTVDTDWLYLELFSSTWDGSEKDKVSSDRATGFFAWSPSGGFIAYRSYSDVLYSSASDGSNHQQVSALADDEVDEFAWSPAPNR